MHPLQGLKQTHTQVSIMSFFEQYAMGIPLLVPSRRLLAEWAAEHGFLFQRTWAGAFGKRYASHADACTHESKLLARVHAKDRKAEAHMCDVAVPCSTPVQTAVLLYFALCHENIQNTCRTLS